MLLELDPGLMIWTWVTFLVLLFLLYKVAWKPILQTIENREKMIQDSIEQAQNAREEAEALLNQHREMMEKAEEEAQKIIKENRSLAEKIKQDIIDSARQEASKLLEKTRQEIEKEKESALMALREEVADLAIGAAGKIIEADLDEEKHRKLVENYIQKIPDSMKN